MQYYILTNSAEKKQVGKGYPQCKGMPSGLGLTKEWFEQQNSMTNLNNIEYPSFIPDLRFELNEKAILTDIVSTSNISAYGLLVNEKVKDLIADLATINHKFYTADLVEVKKHHKYFWLHFVKKDLVGIDIEKSIFYKSDFGFDKGDYIKFKNCEEALEIKRKNDNCFIKLEKLVLMPNYIEEFNHIFYLPIINNIIVSQKIIEIFNNYNITGIELEQIM